MVAAYRIPVDHQLWMGVNQLVVGHPKRICHTLHATIVVSVAKCEDCVWTHLLGNSAHCGGYSFLIIVTVASEVGHHHQIYIPFLDLILGKCSRNRNES